MEPRYKVVTPRKEVREGRSFNPGELAIALEQVVARTAPEDYRDPEQFFARYRFPRALKEHAGLVLRRLAGETANTARVLTQLLFQAMGRLGCGWPQALEESEWPEILRPDLGGYAGEGVAGCLSASKESDSESIYAKPDGGWRGMTLNDSSKNSRDESERKPDDNPHGMHV